MDNRKIIYLDDAIDAVQKLTYADGAYGYADAKDLVDSLENVSLAQPEIIICTECKYYDVDTEQCNNDKGLRFIDFGNPERMWCSWAERRDG